jgi:hypothetical protein
MSNPNLTIVNLICPYCNTYIKHASVTMERLFNCKKLKCMSCSSDFGNPYYLGLFDVLFSSKQAGFIAELQGFIREEKEQEDEERRQILEKEREETIKKERVEAYQRKLNESYFVEEDGGEKPYSEDDIKDLMRQGELKLSSKIKYGYETEEYSPLFSFEEFNQDYKKFM